MDRREFDKFADEYRSLLQANLALSGETPEYFAEYKIEDLKRLAGTDAPAPERRRFLDFGAGVGSSAAFFRKHFPVAELTCVDVSLKSLEIARARVAGDAALVAFDGSRLPFAGAAFDYAFAACVFHHVDPRQHPRLLGELRRVLKPGGRVMLYEHNPLNPLTVRTVNACAFDAGAILIGARALKAELVAAGFRTPRLRYRVFFPRALRWLRPAEAVLGWLPLGAQYYLWAEK